MRACFATISCIGSLPRASHLIFDGIRQLPDLLDDDGDHIAVAHEDRRLADKSNALRGPCHDHGSRQESHGAAQIAHHLCDAEEHVRGVRILHHLAVEDGLNSQVVGIRDLILRDNAGPQGAEGVEALSPGPLLFLLAICQSRALTSLPQV